jgi:NNP family nitrate/nitrite transporter-like MFS transporter
MDGSSKTAPAGQASALWMSTIAFTVCFAVWTIFSIIGIQIQKELRLNETQFGLLVGTPILTGSLIRLMLGIWTDQYGGRLVYTLVMLSAAQHKGGSTWRPTTWRASPGRWWRMGKGSWRPMRPSPR